ncbi:MAG: GatB/YqeY domain-containing protein [Candidatus Levybacteria bacterium]|nr:GatB/YqeY domain-containing protein [Candidatus Levybacteria bacterium]
MLKDKVQEDLKQAMMAKDELKLSTIRMLKSAIQYHEIQKGADRAPAPAKGEGADQAKRGSPLASEAKTSVDAVRAERDSGGERRYEATDEDVIEVIGREVKKRNEAIELYKKGGREELAQKEEEELEILKTYLPEQMSEAGVRKLVEGAIAQTGASSMQDMGKVMGALMPKVRGRADATLVSNIVRESLS